MFGPLRMFSMIFFIGTGIYLGIKLEHARLSSPIDSICKSPNLKSALSKNDAKILCE